MFESVAIAEAQINEFVIYVVVANSIWIFRKLMSPSLSRAFTVIKRAPRLLKKGKDVGSQSTLPTDMNFWPNVVYARVLYNLIMSHDWRYSGFSLDFGRQSIGQAFILCNPFLSRLL
ncbi:unnamed protein product [Protopolystoma xenopodis]|uniref:Uncharacterized protein n=1 Tax=Protopolystoma xenopodis TaxID=117903 RepID=A0A448WYB2_9PLAT|nr:unnamed protein product [Protopolystoma xenopodis]